MVSPEANLGNLPARAVEGEIHPPRLTLELLLSELVSTPDLYIGTARNNHRYESDKRKEINQLFPPPLLIPVAPLHMMSIEELNKLTQALVPSINRAETHFQQMIEPGYEMSVGELYFEDIERGRYAVTIESEQVDPQLLEVVKLSPEPESTSIEGMRTQSVYVIVYPHPKFVDFVGLTKPPLRRRPSRYDDDLKDFQNGYITTQAMERVLRDEDPYPPPGSLQPHTLYERVKQSLGMHNAP